MEQNINKGNIFFDNYKGEIKISGADQFMHEILTWERALDFYKQENAFLKTRLSQVVDNNTDKSFLDLAEHFNNRFILTDEYIKELIRDIRMQKELVKQSILGNNLQDEGMNVLQKKLRAAMEHFEKEISKIKNEFNKKLVSFLRIS